jgi:UDP-GlcNAc:undecaprenyl-phosphate GlcNAc-1-phosphate transferase
VLVAGVTILLVNGVNLIDGLDGLAGGVSAVAAGVFVLLLRGDSRGVACALGLALIGFLIYNCPPARVYLGDGGSYLIGTCLALLVATAWQTGVPSERGLASLLVVALPAAEIVLAITRRARRRTSLTEGDRDHPYDRMVRRGWPRVAATATYVVVELLLGVVAILVARTKTLVGPLSADIAVAVVVLALIGTTIVMFPPDGTRNT